MIEKEQITLRPATPEDDNFLFAVYASSRAEEMARVPWTPEQQESFLRMQFTAQKQHYAAEFPNASHDIILFNGMAAGRIYLDRGPAVFHILDITVLPAYRNQGIGSVCLQAVLAEAGNCNQPVTIYVESFNPSLRLFERLGFQRSQEKGFHFLMTWSSTIP
ncbi:MAG TPA: N-acetyltransferase [Candidatus Angelobacter sp.]|nr:N-acetyltransferase [Candidatus Angelobacter sp.]